MIKKNILKNVKALYEAVLRVLKRSVKRARASSEATLLQIYQNVFFVPPGLYEQFLKELESRQDRQTKKKD